MQTAYLLPSVPFSLMKYGSSLDLDGNRIVIGADGDSTITGNEGSVYVYDRIGGIWVETQILPPPPIGSAIGFGNTAAIRGNELFAGARIANASEREVYADTFDGVRWNPQQILPPFVSTPSLFGQAVCVRGGLAGNGCRP